jgi:putative phosphotransacetylase
MAADDREAEVRAATEARGTTRQPEETVVGEAPVGVSGPHLHLTPGDLATLFGAGASLTEARPLRQPGQFAARETVAVVGPAGSLAGVRVVGPTRSRTLVELTAGNVVSLGLGGGEVRAGEPFPVVLAGPAGVVRVAEGGVVARRHLHVPLAEAAAFGWTDGASVRARLGVPGRSVIFEEVWVRVSATAALEFHLDRDEANACGARTGDRATILGGGAGVPVEGGVAPAGVRPLLTEGDVVDAHRRGTTPAVAGAILTPYAREAIRKYFPELLENIR